MPAGAARYVTLTAVANGAIEHVDFILDSTLFATVTAPSSANTYSTLFTAPALSGTHQLSAQVYDSSGNVSGSNVISIQVNNQVATAPTVSLSTPASGAFLPTGIAATISGTATSTSGTVAGVQVFANGLLIGSATVTGDTWTIPWTPTTLSSTQLTAIATDTQGNSVASPAITVTVTDASSPAITLAVTPGTNPAGGTTLPAGAVRNIVASVVPSTGRAVVRVEYFVNGTKVGESDVAPYSYRFTAPAVTGTYVFSARATDNTSEARDTQYVFTVVSPVGSPPNLNLLTPTTGTTVVPATPVSIAASATSAGSITSVEFYANGAPITGTNPILTAPYSSTFTPASPGTYVLDAIATDDRGNTALSNAVNLIAAFGTPVITILSPSGTTARATPGVPLTINASAQGGSGASVLLVEFLLDGVQIGTATKPTTATGTTYTFAWTPTATQIGSHVLTARVTDTNSQVAVSAPPITVTVANVVGTPPSVTIVAPTGTAAANIQSLSTVNFVANSFATGTGNNLTSVEFFLNGTSVGLAAREQSTNTYRLAYNFGNYDFTQITPVVNATTGAVVFPLALYAIAKDSNGNQTISATTTLSISTSTEAPPSVSLIALGTPSVAQGTSFIMIATPTSPAGTVTSLQLFVNGVASGAAISSPAAQTLVTYTPQTAGTFNLFVVATDDSGNTAISTPSIALSVTATTPPTTALIAPSDDSTVTTVGAPVFLVATASGSTITQIPSVSFVATGSNGARTTINATRVGTTTTYRAVWTPTAADTYTVVSSATVGAVSSNSSVSHRVLVNNVVGIAPVVTNVTFPSSATSASTATLTATATSASSAITGVEFFVNLNSIGQAARAQQTNLWQITTSFGNLTAGSYQVVAIAHDASGNVAASTTGTITITAATTAAPTISITANPTSVAFSQPIALTAIASSATGSISQVQYYVNGTSIGTSSNASTSYAVNLQTGTNTSLPTTLAGTYNVYAVATDNAGNTNVSPTIAVTVKRNNPILDNDAFILQTYTDVTNTTANSTQLANFDAQLAAGTLTRAQLVTTLMTNNVNGTGNANFTNLVNALAAYYVIMGQWPTTANYTTLFNQRGTLSTVIGTILSSPEYVVKYGPTPTAAQFNANYAQFTAFATTLWQNAGLGSPSTLAVFRFQNNDTATATLGRGYAATNASTGAAVGLNQALAEFITLTNSANTALINLATCAALYYQLDKPAIVTAAQALTATTPVVTQDAVATRIAALAAMPDLTTVAGSVLSDVLYIYRFVTILTQPQSLTIAAKSGALFRVSAEGQPPLAYQWLFNGTPISGATGSLLSLTNVDASKTGAYTCVVSSAVGSSTSDPAILTLSTSLTRLINISTRGVTGGGAQTLIAGFVVSTPAGAQANQTRQVLIRVVGPGLAAQGISTGFLPDPRLEVYGSASSSVPILSNDNWGTQTTNAATNATAVTAIQQATTRIGAFALPNVNSLDAVVLATLSPGNYTVEAKGQAANSTGIVLIEVYDVSTASTATTPKPINVSTRGSVGTGANAMVAGFVINGGVSRRMLIRGVGPTLANFGLPAAALLANPQLSLFDSSSNVIKTNAGWTGGDDAAIIAAAAVSGGAFPLGNGSSDAAMLIMLAPGAYTVQLGGANNTTGLGLVEVYDVDP